MSHTKEPLHIGFLTEKGRNICAPDTGRVIATVKDDEDAYRIVACFNACVGIPTDMVSHVVAFGLQGQNRVSAELSEVRAERDTAWEELRKIREAIMANPEESTFDEVARIVSQRNRALDALENLLNVTPDPPDANCSCHISPPCSDCIDNSVTREAIADGQSIITEIRQ